MFNFFRLTASFFSQNSGFMCIEANVKHIDRKLSTVGTIYTFYHVQLSDELTIRMARSSANISIHLNIFIKELLTTIQKSKWNFGNSTFIVAAKVKSIIFENSHKPFKINSN